MTTSVSEPAAPSVRTLGAATASSLGLRLAGMAVGFVTSSLLARGLAPAGFGELALAITLATGAAQVADAGISVAVSTRVASAERAAERALGSGLALRSAFSIIAAIAIIGAGAAGAFGASGPIVAVVALSVPLSAASVLSAGSTARFRPQIGATVALLQGILWCGVVIVCTRSDEATLMWLAAGHVAVVLIQTAAGVLLNRRVIRIGRPHLDEARRLLAHSWPLAVTAVSTMAYYRLDSVILFSTRGSAEVGLYAAAYKFLDVLQIFPSILVGPLLPLAVRYRERERHFRSEFFGLVLRAGTVIGIMAATSLYLLAGPLVSLVYGAEFESATTALRLLAVAFFGICLGYVGTTLGSALGAGKVIAAVSTGIAVFSLAVHLWAAPRWGADGAAGVTAVTEMVIGTTMIFVAARRSDVALPYRRLLPVVVLGPLTVVVGDRLPLAWPLSYFLSMALLLAGLMVARTIALADFRLLMSRRSL